MEIKYYFLGFEAGYSDNHYKAASLNLGFLSYFGMVSGGTSN